jgi:hypothetical protein
MVAVLTGGEASVVVQSGGVANCDATKAEVAAHELGDVSDAAKQRGQVGGGRARGVGSWNTHPFVGMSSTMAAAHTVRKSLISIRLLRAAAAAKYVSS